ncbi:hypothetical protein AB6A40_011596 [Gnathostoma spinigerum]|uniref:Uncharacterized protein n=1 Tax=Gnathostoma spinigerum TaxID=75299 RepID=A0ABD6F484_9BILA
MLTGVAVRFFLVVRLVALASDSSDTFDSYSILKGIDEKEDGGILAGIIADFMSDSQVQLVVDLDLFKSLFVDTAHRLEYGVRSGDESYAQQLIELLKPLKVSLTTEFCLLAYCTCVDLMLNLMLGSEGLNFIDF